MKKIIVSLLILSGCVMAGSKSTLVTDGSNERSASELKTQIDAAVKALDKDGLFKLAMDLCDIPSPTGYEEAAAEMYHERMRQAGLHSTLQPFAPGRSTVLGTYKGTGGGKTLMFIGHLDTFLRFDEKGQPNLKPPSAKIVDSKWVYGTGMSNMKGALAAYLAAVKAVKKAKIPLSGDVLIAGSAGAMQNSPVDEFQEGCYRGYAVGTQHMLVRGAVADMCVLGEPTKLDIVTQHFGHTHVKISIGPKRNAINSSAEIIRALEEWTPDYQRRKTVAGMIPDVKVIAIKGGNPWRPWPAMDADLYVHVETPPKELPITVKHEIRKVLNKVRKKNPELKVTAELYATNPGAFVPEDNPIVTAVREAHTHTFGKAPRIGAVNWHSDATHLNRYGVPTVNYGASRQTGPGVPGGDHLHVDDLVDMTRVYIDLIVRVCGASAL